MRIHYQNITIKIIPFKITDFYLTTHKTITSREVMIKQIFILLFSLVIVTTTPGQDLSAIKTASPIKISGNFNGAFNYTLSENSSIPPTGYNTGININFNFYNALNIPLSFAYSSYGTSFNTLSLNRFGISPSYKSIKIHAGHRSYVLSPYIMSGMTVLGGGVELSPRKFNFLAFYGKISDPYSISNELIEFRSQNIDLFNRNAYGLRLGFGKSSNRWSISAFHAKDNIFTGTTDSLSKYNVRGKENFAIASDLTQTFFNALTLTGSGALSIVTNDINGDAIKDSNVVKWIDRTSFITTINATTRYAFAYDGKISLRINTFNIGFKYQHIDPFYNTFGITYLQNNFDNYLIDMNGNLFKGKLSLFSSFGIQYVNATSITGLPQKRNVANVNANLTLSKAINLSGNYSNMVQNSIPKIEEVSDSLRITTNNVGWSGTLSIKPGKGKERPHQINFNASSNTFDVVNADTISLSNTNNNYGLDYKYTLKNKWSFGGGGLYNTGHSNALPDVKRYGVMLHAGKTITEGLNLKLNGAYRINETSGVKDGNVINAGLGINYQFKKSHRFSLNVTQLIRKTTLLASKNETRFRANYNYNF